MGTLPNILSEITAFCAERGMAETTFGRRAVNDGKFVDRLRRGRRIWPETEAKARDFIARELSAKDAA